MANKKILVLGVDGMDPKMTKKYLAQGKLPNVAKFIKLGSAREDVGMLGAVPTITPPCWTTLATGAYPSTHAITCFWKQSPDNLDAIVYNLDSRNCLAEQLWNVTAEAGMKTLVWHWPGSSWPPSSNNSNLNVVDGTQPGSVNMGIAQLDFEKIIVANADITEVKYMPKAPIAAGMGCIITDLDDTVATDVGDGVDLVWGDTARGGQEIFSYVLDFEDTELVALYKVPYDLVNSPIKDAEDWIDAPAGAKEFTIITSNGLTKRPALILSNDEGQYDRVAVYKSKKATQPLVVLEKDILVPNIIDEINVAGELKQACRMMKILDLAEDGTSVRMWVSNALDIANDALWHPKALYRQIVDNVSPVPPVSLIGGNNDELIERVFLPSWEHYNEWQSNCLHYLIEENNYDVIFSHIHNVDCAGHQLWHFAKNQEEWPETDAVRYQGFIEETYLQTDKYLGSFLPLLEDGWTIMITSDHGLIVSEEMCPIIGEPDGVSVKVLEELGYTTLKKGSNGERLKEIDWANTKAIANRGNHIYINLKGRNKTGIVDPADQYELEDEIISALYDYRDPKTGKRVISVAVRNKEAIIYGLSGRESGDIIYFIEENFNRVHGDGFTTQVGSFDSSVMPVFIAAGAGIKTGYTTDRVIRQVDVAPTIASLLKVRMPKQCEGAAIYQILED